jgi:hypothetical protein
MMRDFVLTSWAHTEELFHEDDISTKKVRNLEFFY